MPEAHTFDFIGIRMLWDVAMIALDLSAQARAHL